MVALTRRLYFLIILCVFQYGRPDVYEIKPDFYAINPDFYAINPDFYAIKHDFYVIGPLFSYAFTTIVWIS